MVIRIQRVACTLVLVTGLATIVGCDTGNSPTPKPGPFTVTPTPTPSPTTTPAPTPTPTPLPSTTPTPVGTVSGGVCITSASPRCVSWIAPTTRKSGTVISSNEIAGYIIGYGSSIDTITNKIIITDRTATEYTFSQLASGTYYITVSAYDTNSVESPVSAVLVRSF